jgi:hypothetical protein
MSELFDFAKGNFHSVAIGKPYWTPVGSIMLGLRQLAGALREELDSSHEDKQFQAAVDTFHKSLKKAAVDGDLRAMAAGLEHLTNALRERLK